MGCWKQISWVQQNCVECGKKVMAWSDDPDVVCEECWERGENEEREKDFEVWEEDEE